jgi:outer membrane protein OmpA-like peptidoglycan-associated protein
MNSKHLALIFMICVLGSFTADVRAQNVESVKNFYKNLKETVSAEPLSLKPLIALVKKDRLSAEKCLGLLKQKLGQASGTQKEALGLLYRQLLGGIVLTSAGGTCDDNVTKALTEMLKMQPGNADKVIILRKLTEVCSQSSPELYAELGDRLFNEGQYGVAAEVYKKSLKRRDNEGVKQALEITQGMIDQYVRVKTPSDLTNELAKIVQPEPFMAPEKRRPIRKINPPRSLQLKGILFDEWSHEIKQESLPVLQHMGKGIKDNLVGNPSLFLSIEGHTDNRGQYEKNIELSRSRAEAIKKYLVDNFQIDPNRLMVVGYGPDKPFCSENSEAGWAQNRRVEFKIPESTK